MSARGRKSANPLDKKVPENPKYKHVRATVDTGASITKYMEKMEELKRDYNFRKDEIFKRMKIPTFVQLVVQVADYDDYSDGPENVSTDRPDTADKEVQRIQRGEASNGGSAGDTARQSPDTDTRTSRLEQVINGMGEVDLDTPLKSNNQPLSMMGSNCPYLLLDVRDRDAYDECHIITAKSYPTAMLARSVNYETQDMLKFKNQAGKIILLYDDDERISHRAATTLVQRGYDNLFMLSGGLKVAYKLFPDGLITGTLPAGLLEETPQGSKGSKNREPPPKVPADIESFTPELIDKLAIHLDGALSDRSVGSRLSKASKPGRSSTSTSSISSLGRKPFKC